MKEIILLNNDVECEDYKNKIQTNADCLANMNVDEIENWYWWMQKTRRTSIIRFKATWQQRKRMVVNNRNSFFILVYLWCLVT